MKPESVIADPNDQPLALAVRYALDLDADPARSVDAGVAHDVAQDLAHQRAIKAKLPIRTRNGRLDDEVSQAGGDQIASLLDQIVGDDGVASRLPLDDAVLELREPSHGVRIGFESPDLPPERIEHVGMGIAAAGAQARHLDRTARP